MRLLLLVALVAVLAAQPLQDRLLIAASRDGLDWQRLNLVLNDSAAVPDAIVTRDGLVYAYFQGLWTHFIDGIMLGISADGITGWTFSEVRIPGTEGWRGRPCDPDISFRNDTFRLYFTGDPTGDMTPETYSAVSADGMNFTLEPGIRFGVTGEMVLDPSTLWTGDTLQYFAGGAPQGRNWHTRSVDGLNFTREPDFQLEQLMMANGLEAPGGYRWYGFSNNPTLRGIRSLFSANGDSWWVEPGYRLQIDTTTGLESLFVADPAVVLKDSIYLMYYTTRKPRTHPGIEETDRAGREPSPAFPSTSLPAATQGRRLEILDVSGRLVSSTSPGNTSPAALDLRSLPAGVYFVRFQWKPGAPATKVQLVR